MERKLLHPFNIHCVKSFSKGSLWELLLLSASKATLCVAAGGPSTLRESRRLWLKIFHHLVGIKNCVSPVPWWALLPWVRRWREEWNFGGGWHWANKSLSLHRSEPTLGQDHPLGFKLHYKSLFHFSYTFSFPFPSTRPTNLNDKSVWNSLLPCAELKSEIVTHCFYI